MERNNIDYLLDANIMIDFLVERNPHQHKKAKEIFEKIKQWEINALVIHWVIMEVIFIMTKRYNFEKKKILFRCIYILKQKHIINPQKELLINSLLLAAKENISFVDWILTNYSNTYTIPVLTFDKKLLKLCWTDDSS